MRTSLAFALLCGALTAAPAHAQSSTEPMREYIGRNVPYRVEIPARWFLVEDGSRVSLSEGSVIMMVSARYLTALQPGTPRSEMRRILTSPAATDSLLMAYTAEVARKIATPGYHCAQGARGLRELAGQRAAFTRIRCAREGGDSVRFDAWITVKDGVMYGLTFGGVLRDYAAHVPMFDRVRASLVFPASTRATTASTQPPADALVEHVGKTIPYRLGIPFSWGVEDDGAQLKARHGPVVVSFRAESAMALGAGKNASPSEVRRAMATIMASDSLLIESMDSWIREEWAAWPNLRCTTQARQVRELAGKRAGYLSFICDPGNGTTARYETWGTYKDGVLYTLLFAANVEPYAENEGVLSRIRDSLVLP